MARAGRRTAVLSFAAILVGSGAAEAGPWAQPAREGLDISDLSYERGDFGEVWRASYWIEYGLGARWTAFGKLDSEVRPATGPDDRSGGLLGLRRTVWSAERSAAAVEAAWVFGEETLGDECTGAGYEVRASYGRSTRVAGREAFGVIEGGWRRRGGCERALALVALGWRITDDLRLSARGWAEQGGSQTTGRAELGVQRAFGSLEVGLAWREEVSGAFEEGGVVASLWRRF